MKNRNKRPPACGDCKWFVGQGPCSKSVVANAGTCHYNPPAGGLWPSVTTDSIGCSKHEEV